MTAPRATLQGAQDRALLRELRWVVEEFHYAYAATLDSGEIERWPDFFTEDGTYSLVARDNAEHALPLSLMWCEGKGMLKDRAYAVRSTEMYAPRYVSHHISQIQVLGIQNGLISATAKYIILETLIDEPTRLLQSGRYEDLFVGDGDGLLLKARRCIYDTVLVPTCVVFPP